MDWSRFARAAASAAANKIHIADCIHSGLRAKQFELHNAHALTLCHQYTKRVVGTNSIYG